MSLQFPPRDRQKEVELYEKVKEQYRSFPPPREGVIWGDTVEAPIHVVHHQATVTQGSSAVRVQHQDLRLKHADRAEEYAPLGI